MTRSPSPALACTTLGLLLLALACGGGDKDDSAAPEGDTDADTDTDTDTDTDADSDITTMLVVLGEATTDGASYEGQEAVVLLADAGMGEELCRIEYAVSGSNLRDDCEDCVWAFDLQRGAATVVVEDRCAEVGWDAATIAAVENSWVVYGFATEAIGHADALMVFDADAWGSVAYASWDDSTGAFDYEWDRGYHVLSAGR